MSTFLERCTVVAILLVSLTTLVGGACARAVDEDGVIRWNLEEGRWSAEKANAWYAEQGWRTGANFLPSTASNQFEMWQAETWDPATIDRELGWAAGIGFNTMRVYLHDMLWTADAAGFEHRMDEYLALADRHGIKTIFVPFDCVWDPYPKPGPQKEPVPHVHNSRWVQSPHVDVQKDPARYEELLKPYLTGILTRFKDDARILAWDLLNEPGNAVPQYEDNWDNKEREDTHLILLNRLFDWARVVNPSQPLTAGQSAFKGDALRCYEFSAQIQGKASGGIYPVYLDDANYLRLTVDAYFTAVTVSGKRQGQAVEKRTFPVRPRIHRAYDASENGNNLRIVKLEDKIILFAEGLELGEIPGRWPDARVGLFAGDGPCTFNGMMVYELA